MTRARGQAVVEYALILALVSVLAIAALVTIGERGRRVALCTSWVLDGHEIGVGCDSAEPSDHPSP